ncbi:hypothetical protein LINGRAHAP2_LOCUS9664 [Linum grandiflorum]
MVDNNISDTILQTDVLQVVPKATESNVIPDTDSAPKHKDSAPADSGTKDELSLVAGGTAGNDQKSNKGHHHIRRFSTGNIAVPYTKVKILSRYLEPSSPASCHDYCKYGMRREGEDQDQDHHDHSLAKRFNDALGKGHQMFKHTASLMERRNKRLLHVIPTTKTPSSSFDSPKKTDSPRSSNRRSARTNSKAVHHSPRRPDSDHVASKYSGGAGGTRSRLNSSSASSTSSASALAVVGSPKLESKPNLVRSRTALPKLSGSELGLVASSPPPRHEKHRRSKSVSKLETSSSSSYSSPSVDKLPILSKIYSSSPTIVSDSSALITNQKFQTLISPLIHMSKSSLSSSVKQVEGSKKSLLPKSLSDKEDRKDQTTSKRPEEASVSSSPVESLRKARTSSVRTEQKGSGDDHQEQTKLVEKATLTSPPRHKFLRRQSISEPLRSPWKKLNPARINGGKREKNRKPIIPPLKDHHPNNVKKVEADPETKDEKGSDEKAAIVVNENKSHVKLAGNSTQVIKSSSSLVSQAKHEANRKRFNRAQNNGRQSPLFRDKYRILRRTGARSVVSEPLGPSDDCLSVMSSTDSCETDHVLEQKAMERMLASRINAHFSRGGVRRRAFIGGYREEQPRRLKFRPGRVIEFKSEINSPCRRLKFKRRSSPRNGNGSPKSNIGMIFGVLRKAGGGRRSDQSNNNNNNHRVQFADVVIEAAEKVVLRHQEMQQEKESQASLNNVIEETASKLAEERRSKVKALVGAFESLITLQDSKPTTDPTVTA